MLEVSRKPTLALRAPAAEGGPFAFLAPILAITAKDLRSELRSRQVIGGSLVFAILTIVIFGFAFDLQGEMSEIAGPGVLWVAILLAGVTGFGHVFAEEQEQGGLQGLRLAAADGSTVFIGKMLAVLLLTFGLELFLLPVFALITNASIISPGLLSMVILGTIGFVTVGTLFSAMSATSRSRELLLPVLLLPVVTPVLVAAVEGTHSALQGDGFADLLPALTILTAFDLIFVALCPVLFEFVMEEMG